MHVKSIYMQIVFRYSQPYMDKLGWKIRPSIIIYGVEAAKRDLAHIFSSFQIISYSKRHLCPLQLPSYALEISLSIRSNRVLNF